jgi:co-chaperonin GroES (HSP10)
MESKYLSKFTKLSDFKDFVLVGERMLIEVIPQEEMKTKGGIIIADPGGYKTETQTNRPLLGVVLLVGQGYISDDGESEPHEYKPGEVVIVSKMGPLYYSEFPGIGATGNSIAMTRSSEVHLSWPSIEAFKKFRETLSE